MPRWLLVMLVACAHEPIDRAPVPAPAPAPMAAPKPPPSPPTPVATRSPDLSPTANKLANETMFAVTGVGFAGATSRGELLTRKLAGEPDAVVMFERLATDPNRVARLYAYWALRTLDPARAARMRPTLEHDATSVETMRGCIGTHEYAHTLLAEAERHAM